MSDFKKAISYSLRPHELGFCGPGDEGGCQTKLKNYLEGEQYQGKEIAGLLDKFVGAANYYSLIARLNGIEDKYDEKVIEAYWLGNELLDKIKVDDIKKMVMNKFVGPKLLTKEEAQEKINGFPKEGAAHHTFHIFFVGAVTGRGKAGAKLKDKCKVSWGEVKEIFSAENKIKVKTKKLFPEERDVVVKIDWDKAFAPELRAGDTVSFHWGRVSEKITREQLDNLIKYTGINYKALMGVN